MIHVAGGHVKLLDDTAVIDLLRGDELGFRLGLNPPMLRAHKAAQPSERERRRRDFADRIGVDYRYLPDDFDVED